MKGDLEAFIFLEKKLKITNHQCLMIDINVIFYFLIFKNSKFYFKNKDLCAFLVLNDVQAPRVYYKITSDFENKFYVVFKNKILFEINNTTLEEILTIFYSIYFCFDINYPLCFKQILAIFHELLIKNEECPAKRTKSHMLDF